MKKTMISILIAILVLTVFAGCGKKETAESPARAAANIPSDRSLTIVPDTTLPDEEHNVQFYQIGESAEEEVLIAEEAVPLAPAPKNGAVTKRQAEAIAIASAGFNQDSVAFLHTKYVSEDVDSPYFRISFQNNGANYVILVDEATGAIFSEN